MKERVHASQPGWLSSKTNAVWRRVVFFLGDLKKLNAFPWFTWAQHEYLVPFEEILPALALIKYGDIGLHRAKGYLSNVFIPGFMKHAWIHVQDGVEKPEIVEALSEGVLRRSAIHPMHSDYTIILTPRETAEVTDEQRKGACLKAKQIEGVRYDDRFQFNIEQELQYYQGTQVDEARQHLDIGKEQMRHYNIAFSCTEVVAYAWWHQRETLGISRQSYKGKTVILADTFLNKNWRIKWASNSVTVDLARKMKLSEERVSLIEEYRQSKPVGHEPFSTAVLKQLRV
ncbi:MAG: hypothetical protein ACE5JI_11370 [Acidobacteriota bacterium]